MNSPTKNRTTKSSADSHDKTGFLALPARLILIHPQSGSPIRQDPRDLLQLRDRRLCAARRDDRFELGEENEHVAAEEARDGLCPSFFWYVREVVAQPQAFVGFLVRVEGEVAIVDL